MSEAHEPGPAVEVIVNAGEEAAGGPGDGGEVAPVEVVEEVADAAVQIAEIEANRDITVEAIRAEASVEQMAQLNRDEIASLQLELGQCRNRITELETTNAELMAAQSTSPQSDPPPNPPPESEADSAEVADPTSAEPPAEPPPPKKRYHKLI